MQNIFKISAAKSGFHVLKGQNLACQDLVFFFSTSQSRSIRFFPPQRLRPLTVFLLSKKKACLSPLYVARCHHLPIES